jgi:hypothetical protein
MKMMKTTSMFFWSAIVLSGAAVSCSRAAARTGTLFEGTGLETLRIDEATVADAIKALGAPEAPAKTLSNGVVELWPRPFLMLSFVPAEEGQEPPRLYAISAVLRDPPYTGTTSKGIGLLDSIERVHEVYGEPEAVWITVNTRIHYYPQQGMIITTTHPTRIPPKIYELARTVLRKTPDDGPTASIVTEIRVVRPFAVIEGATTAMAGQRVLSTRPKTDLLVSEF